MDKLRFKMDQGKIPKMLDMCISRPNLQQKKNQIFLVNESERTLYQNITYIATSGDTNIWLGQMDCFHEYVLTFNHHYGIRGTRNCIFEMLQTPEDDEHSPRQYSRHCDQDLVMGN